MEDKKLNEKESLELITQMIQNTRRNLDAGSGNLFLLWGYVCTLVTLCVVALLYFTNDYIWMWGFFGIPLLGGVLSYLIKRKEQKKITTYTDKVTNEVWQILGFFSMVTALLAIFTGEWAIILPLSAILFSLGSIITGIIIRYTLFSGFPAIGAILGLDMLLDALNHSLGLSGLLMFSVAIVFSMVIPGHILNYKAKKGNNYKKTEE